MIPNITDGLDTSLDSDSINMPQNFLEGIGTKSIDTTPDNF
jgi:hypothetical protein